MSIETMVATTLVTNMVVVVIMDTIIFMKEESEVTYENSSYQ